MPALSHLRIGHSSSKFDDRAAVEQVGRRRPIGQISGTYLRWSYRHEVPIFILAMTELYRWLQHGKASGHLAGVLIFVSKPPGMTLN